MEPSPLTLLDACVVIALVENDRQNVVHQMSPFIHSFIYSFIHSPGKEIIVL